MSLQIIKSVDGKDEYVLLPITIYHALREQIALQAEKSRVKYQLVSFEPADFIENPVALARIKAGMTQEELARRMKVSQAYISKIESQEKLTAKMLQKVKLAIDGKPKR